MDIFNTAVSVFIAIFVLVFIYIISVNLIGARIYPLMKHMSPTNNSSGISQSMYQEKLDRMWTGIQWFFYIIIAIPFLYFIIKLLYEKESVSVYYR